MLRYMTAGESHGTGLMAILDGMPSGLEIDVKNIDRELKKRMQGYGRGARMSIESDSVRIVGGVRRGRTLGSPIGLMICNKDIKIDSLPAVTAPRPGHADLAGMMKYGSGDARDILERASARETAARVAAGAVARILLKEFGVRIISHVTRIGPVSADLSGLSFEEIERRIGSAKKIRCADRAVEKAMRAEIDRARGEGDTLGGVFEIVARGVPPGLGSYTQWDRRMDGALARAMMSIPAVKAVSIGQGIEGACLRGSSVHDEISYSRAGKKFARASNNAGGIEGGVTNGEPVIVRGFMKPIATLGCALRTVNVNTKKSAAAARERADVCAVSACGVVGEAAAAFEIASAAVEKFGGDSLPEMKRNYKSYLKQVRGM